MILYPQNQKLCNWPKFIVAESFPRQWNWLKTSPTKKITSNGHDMKISTLFYKSFHAVSVSLDFLIGVTFCGTLWCRSCRTMSPRAVPSKAEPGSTCGIRDRSRRKTAVDRRSLMFRKACNICTRCTATGTLLQRWACCQRTGDTSDGLKWQIEIGHCIRAESPSRAILTWSTALGTRNQFLSLLRFLVLARISEAEVTVAQWRGPILSAHGLVILRRRRWPCIWLRAGAEWWGSRGDRASGVHVCRLSVVWYHAGATREAWSPSWKKKFQMTFRTSIQTSTLT